LEEIVQMMESARLVWVTLFKKAKLIFPVSSECNVLGFFWNMHLEITSNLQSSTDTGGVDATLGSAREVVVSRQSEM